MHRRTRRTPNGSACTSANLRTLADFPEAQGDFLAWVPGAHRQAVQPSTVAYIARLMIHRYHMLGILDEDGYPVQPMEVMYTETSSLEDYGDNVVALESLRAAGTNEVIPEQPVRRVPLSRPHPEPKAHFVCVADVMVQSFL